ncbi:MAG: hypothetical protein HC894_25190 [Microcoleus sp. SM1_3_4]|nr:hypothetical protein [Microcoleus sp. SM1_3_4]
MQGAPKAKSSELPTNLLEITSGKSQQDFLRLKLNNAVQAKLLKFTMSPCKPIPPQVSHGLRGIIALRAASVKENQIENKMLNTSVPRRWVKVNDNNRRAF